MTDEKGSEDTMATTIQLRCNYENGSMAYRAQRILPSTKR